MCNKCEKHHSEVFQNYHQFKFETEKDINEIFTGLCKEKDPLYKLKYFCKNHNKLCCTECITNLKEKNMANIQIVTYALLKILNLKRGLI